MMSIAEGPDSACRPVRQRLARSYFALESPQVAPAGPHERQLTGIWEDVLGVEGLGVEDDFFLVGGDSFAGVTLLEEVEREFGLSLPLSALFDCRTVRRLAARIERLGTRPWPVLPIPVKDPGASHSDKCLVPIRTDGGAAPLFVVHGLHCDAAFAQLLATHLDLDRPVYGFQALGLDGSCPPLRTIEAMATLYIETIRRVRPRGPYVLSGYCFGGHIALEMAHQLSHAGEEVTDLFLIDTPATLIPELANEAIESAVRFAQRNLENWPQARKHFAGGPAARAALGEAAKAYKPRAYAGRTCILASKAAVDRMRHPRFGWARYLPSLTPIFIVAPTRESIVQRRMPAVARCMMQRLRSAPDVAAMPTAGP